MSRKTLILCALALTTFLQGAINQYFYPGQLLPPTAIWLMPIGIFLLFWWYVVDAKQHNYRRGPLLNVGVILLALLAIP